MFRWGEEAVQELAARTRTRMLVAASLASMLLAVVAPHTHGPVERGVLTLAGLGAVALVARIYFRAPLRWRSELSPGYAAVLSASLAASWIVFASSGLPDSWRYPAAALLAICPNVYSLYRIRRRVA